MIKLESTPDKIRLKMKKKNTVLDKFMKMFQMLSVVWLGDNKTNLHIVRQSKDAMENSLNNWTREKNNRVFR